MNGNAKNLLLDLRDIRKETEAEVNLRRPYLKIEYDEFKPLLVEQANILLRQKNVWDSFIIDEKNEWLIRQLYLSFFGSTDFQGSLHKGIMVCGPFGTGKTIILESFCLLSNSLNHKKITIIHSMELPDLINEKGFDYYMHRPIFIDDLGKEPGAIKVFGREVRPAIELLTKRYDCGAWTLATSNYTTKTFTEHYGKTISERMKSMFNIIFFPGVSRRTENIIEYTKKMTIFLNL